jgi:hypothetical protein
MMLVGMKQQGKEWIGWISKDGIDTNVLVVGM